MRLIEALKPERSRRYPRSEASIRFIIKPHEDVPALILAPYTPSVIILISRTKNFPRRATRQDDDHHTLSDADGGTQVPAMHDGLPRGMAPVTRLGWRMALRGAKARLPSPAP
jgi:hypothetical protein